MAEVRQEDDPSHDTYMLLSAVSDVERSVRINRKNLGEEEERLEEAHRRIGAVLAAIKHHERDAA